MNAGSDRVLRLCLVDLHSVSPLGSGTRAPEWDSHIRGPTHALLWLLPYLGVGSLPGQRTLCLKSPEVSCLGLHERHHWVLGSMHTPSPKGVMGGGNFQGVWAGNLHTPD